VVQLHDLRGLREARSELELAVVRDQRARKHHGSGRVLAFDDHPTPRAHDIGRIDRIVHLGEQSEIRWVVGVHANPFGDEEAGVAPPRLLLGLAPAGSTGDPDSESMVREPLQSEADTKRQPPILLALQLFPDLEEARLHSRSLHRPHGIGQHESSISACERLPEHLDQVGVHERLSAREPDLFDGQAQRFDLIEELAQLAQREKRQAVAQRAGFHVAVTALDVAEGASVEPQGLKRSQPDRRPAPAVGGQVGILELSVSFHSTRRSSCYCAMPEGSITCYTTPY
jgi:hypothetical protein